MFKMKILNEGVFVYQSKIFHGAKNPPKNDDNYDDCDVQVECNSEENLMLAKKFSKVLR